MREASLVLFAALRRIESKLTEFEERLNECHKLIEQLAMNGVTVNVNVVSESEDE